MSKKRVQRDRLARLLNVIYTLSQNPRGVTVQQLADHCQVAKRTAYRDLKAIEDELGVPVWEAGGRRGLLEGYLLPPIPFSLPEAMTIFLAARLMLQYAHRYDPDIASTFTKLKAVVPNPLKDQIQKTTDWMKGLAVDEHHIHVMATLTEAWKEQRTVKIRYHTLGEPRAKERDIDPYFIEPAAAGHSSYVIAYCHRTDEMRMFKTDRIKTIEKAPETYDMPSTFDANAYFSSSWGVIGGGEAETVRLKFNPSVARLFEEVIWHPSQIVERQPDGSVVMTLTVMPTVELMAWILGWGESVEVLEPAELRRKIAETAQAILDVYG